MNIIPFAAPVGVAKPATARVVADLGTDGTRVWEREPMDSIQDKWKLPVGFLVGKDGVILKDVAAGADPITALAQEGLGKRKGVET